MAPFPYEQQKQQEAAAAAGYSQLPGPGPAASPVAGPTGQHYYPAVAPPYQNPAGPSSSSAYAAPAYPPYPPQQYAAPPHAYPPAPVPGVAVTGYPAAAAHGHHMQPISVAAAPMQGSPALLNQEPCGCCTVGWVLFGIGWLFPICWVVGVLLPFCSKNRHDRRAAIASGIMIAISVAVVVLAVAIPLSIMANAARDGRISNIQNDFLYPPQGGSSYTGGSNYPMSG